VFSDVVDPVEVGQHWSRKIERMLRRGLAARDGRTAGALIDVRYADLVADPLAEVQRVYRSLEQPLTPAAVAAMEAWRATNPQHKHGHHRYRLQDFGLDQQQLRRLFADYCARFAIPSE